MPITQNYRILSSDRMSNKPNKNYLTYITEEEENKIDNLRDEVFVLERGDRTFKIRKRQIYGYGEIDFNKEEDAILVEKFKFLDSYILGVPYPSNYDYETHTCLSPKRKVMWTETVSPLNIIKYAHASLNKPKRVIIFNQDK